ncbi:MAG TPA: hypothetical protein DD811_05010 [Syntrophomonas sp.]|nr:hypothetical protein [Bacillota bacterium]HBQ85822.1 hypothetical protein [Syntrophomonas sp.]HBT15502.1 hypothetical protein [Bacillota bacterium]
MRVLRFEPSKTGAQKLLAEKLRAKKIAFLENQLLEGWEVDIFLPKYYLVVEVDGFYHLSTKQQERDLQKELRLRAAGYHVLRFTNSQVYQAGDKCVQEIKNLVEEHKLKLKQVEKAETTKTGWQKRLEEYNARLRMKEKKDHDSTRGQ